MYRYLLDILRRQRYCNVYAGITMPNDASSALHEHLGFEKIGVYARVGFKAGRWHDTAWYALALQDPRGAPEEIRAVRDVVAHEDPNPSDP